jgi:uncharacterized membrane protein
MRQAVPDGDGQVGRAALLAALVVVPLGTVLPKELAFRGLLLALLGRGHGVRAAALMSSGLFGLWHVLPSLGGGVANAAIAGAVGGDAAGTLLREMMDVPAPSLLQLPLLPLVAAALFTGLVALSRWLRGVDRWMAGRLRRWMGPRAANALGWTAVVAGTWLVASGLLLNGFVAVADRSFSVRNTTTTTTEGVEQPTSGLRSGGPGSLMSWDSLGRQGRNFAGGGPTVEELSAWSGSPATEPVRAYAGTLAAEDVEERAELAVEDLERAGGFDRANLLVATTTGSGWLAPWAVDSFEYLTGGDSAIVGMQYSYLPSWLSYLVDQERAREAGRELFDAVYERWSGLPADDRPKLFVFGLSLGSFGGETAFSGEFDLRNRTAGALFAGPPNFNLLYREFTDGRDPGSREVEPVYRDGRTVRFTNDVAAGVPPASAWKGSRVLYLQHPSDPIVWWSPRLAWDRPDWLGEPPGRDVLDAMLWVPFVTFWQVTADMPLAGAVPSGHGHTYEAEFVDGWATVIQPSGLTPDKAERLRDIVTEESG